MSEISIVINADTRPGYTEERAYCGMGGGAALTGAGGGRSVDFLLSNILNKIIFFKGYDVEVNLFIDVHEPLIKEVQDELFNLYNSELIDNLVFNRHSREYNGRRIRQWQDINYLHTLTLSRGKYIAHFDADASAFRTEDCRVIEEWINLIESGSYKIISYPTIHSPNEGDIPGDNALPSPEGGFDYLWASTRFFFCKRDLIKYDEFIKYLDDNYWISAHNGRKYRYPNVTEQILGFMAGSGKTYYPMKNLDKYMIFCWHDYFKGTIEKLNRMDYQEVYNYIINKCGGIGGACDVCQKEPL